MDKTCNNCKCTTCDRDDCFWYLCGRNGPVNDTCFTDDCSHYYNEQDAIDEGLLYGCGD